MEERKTITVADQKTETAPKPTAALEQHAVKKMYDKIKVPDEKDGWELVDVVKKHTSNFDKKTGEVNVDLNVEFKFVRNTAEADEEIDADGPEEVVSEEMAFDGAELAIEAMDVANIDELAPEEALEELGEVEFDESELTGQLAELPEAEIEEEVPLALSQVLPINSLEAASVATPALEVAQPHVTILPASTPGTRQLAGEAMLSLAAESVQPVDALPEVKYTTFPLPAHMAQNVVIENTPVSTRDAFNQNTSMVREAPRYQEPLAMEAVYEQPVQQQAAAPNYSNNPFYIDMNAPMAPAGPSFSTTSSN